MKLNELIEQAAIARDLRESTKYNYRRLLIGIGIEDDSLSKEELESRVLSVRNINTRRSTAVAIRAVLGVKIKLPKGQSPRSVVPTEDQLRFALMCSDYEVRGLLMAYAGLRLGEACAVTNEQLQGDRLLVDRQVLQFHTGLDKDGHGYSVMRLSPTKSNEATIVIPHWLAKMVAGLDYTDVPKKVTNNLQSVGKKHGIKVNPQNLRRWYATEILKRGGSLKLVQEQLRHTDVATTLRSYVQTNDEDIHKMFD